MMNQYDAAVKVTYKDGRTRMFNNAITADNFPQAFKLVSDDEGYGWPEKTAVREIIYIIKVAA